jgi:type II secretory pathway pseudopilin PulG
VDDVIIPVAFFLILAGAVVAVAYFQSQRNRERDRQYAQAMQEYREAVERARSEQEATRLQLVELGHRLQNVEGLLRSVD